MKGTKRKTPSTSADQCCPAMVVVTSLHSNDVLHGRGSQTNFHPGNVRFRSLIKQRAHEYESANSGHGEKVVIARSVVNTIHSEGGRFLRKADTDERRNGHRWFDAATSSMTTKKQKAATSRTGGGVCGIGAISEESCSSGSSGATKTGMEKEPGAEEDEASGCDDASKGGSFVISKNDGPFIVITDDATLVLKAKQAFRHFIRTHAGNQQPPHQQGSSSSSSRHDEREYPATTVAPRGLHAAVAASASPATLSNHRAGQANNAAVDYAAAFARGGTVLANKSPPVLQTRNQQSASSYHGSMGTSSSGHSSRNPSVSHQQKGVNLGAPARTDPNLLASHGQSILLQHLSQLLSQYVGAPVPAQTGHHQHAGNSAARDRVAASASFSPQELLLPSTLLQSTMPPYHAPHIQPSPREQRRQQPQEWHGLGPPQPTNFSATTMSSNLQEPQSTTSSSPQDIALSSLLLQFALATLFGPSPRPLANNANNSIRGDSGAPLFVAILTQLLSSTQNRHNAPPPKSSFGPQHSHPPSLAHAVGQQSQTPLEQLQQQSRLPDRVQGGYQNKIEADSDHLLSTSFLQPFSRPPLTQTPLHAAVLSMATATRPATGTMPPSRTILTQAAVTSTTPPEPNEGDEPHDQEGQSRARPATKTNHEGHDLPDAHLRQADLRHARRRPVTTEQYAALFNNYAAAQQEQAERRKKTE